MHDPMIGATAGSFRVTAKVSVGGMGTVYRAEHMLIGKPAAVKVLHPEFTANRDIVSRFFNEAKATTAIQHPGIVEVFDFGYLPTGHAFLVMEFLEGMTLAQRIKVRGPIHEAEAAMVLRPVCSALAAAHAKGIVHRDLKPDNIFLVEDADAAGGERPKILDFGIAKLTDIGLAGTVTKTGAVMGTPTYMSPEQCKGIGEVDHRADLYSLGCILYELITGRPPFVNRGAGELLGMHLFVEPESPCVHMTGISPEVEALIMQLLAKDPALRVQSAKELANHFAAIAQRYGQGTPSMVTRASSVGFGGAPTLTGQGMPMPMPTPHHTPFPTPSSSPMIHATPWQPTHAQQPTTLSGAASQSIVAPAPRKRRGVYVAIGAMVACAGLGITIGTLHDGGDAPAAAQPAIVTRPVPAPINPPAPFVVTPPVAVTPPTPVPVAPPTVAPAPVTPPAITPPPAPLAVVPPVPAKPRKPLPHPDKPKKPDAPKSDLPLATDI